MPREISTMASRSVAPEPGCAKSRLAACVSLPVSVVYSWTIVGRSAVVTIATGPSEATSVTKLDRARRRSVIVDCAACWLSTTTAIDIGVVAGVTRTISRPRSSSVIRRSDGDSDSSGALDFASSAVA